MWYPKGIERIIFSHGLMHADELLTEEEAPPKWVFRYLASPQWTPEECDTQKLLREAYYAAMESGMIK
jgi:hypothetical protein